MQRTIPHLARYLAAILTLTALILCSSLAQSHAQNASNAAILTIIDGWSEPDGSRIAALRVSLEDGWKTYWRAPGDAGIPPEFSWRGARNVADVQILWPAPVVFYQSGMRSVGYVGHVTLPIRVTPRDPARPVELRGKMSLGLCSSDVCVPASLAIRGTLNPSRDASIRPPAIAAAMAALPFSGAEAGVSSARCTIDVTKDGTLHLDARIAVPRAGKTEAVVVETADPSIWVSEPDVHRQGRLLTVSARMVPQSGAVAMLDRAGLRFTLIGSDHTVDIKGCSG